MDKKKLHELYQKLAEETVHFCNQQEILTVDDLINISASLVCFSTDLLRNNSGLEDSEIKSIIQEALDLSILPSDELEQILSEQEESEDYSEVTDSAKDKKFLN